MDIKSVWEKIVEPEPILPKDISYCVNYFEENIDDDNFTLVKTETLTGKEGDLTEVSPESKEGFADAVYKNVTLSDGENIVIDVKYSRKHYVIYFQLNDFELKTFAGKFGAKIQYPEIPERKGYYFVNWSENPIYVPAENLTIVANWKQKETAEYTINYYIQNINDDDYEFFDSKVFEGKTNSYPHLTFTSKKGFTVTCDNEIIECDGSTVINAYYTRNYYTVYFLVDNNIYYTVNQKYESKIELPPEPFKEGYKFEKWNNVVDTVPNSNHYITAIFSTLKDVPYIINLMLQNIYDDEYTLYKVENGTGETNTYTQPWENDDIVGFDLKKCDSAIIKGDASTVINAYYDREIHSMTIDGKTITGRYGEEITVPKDPSKIGYTFNGWSESIPDTIQARDIEIVSTWVTKKDTPYKITFYYEGVESSDYSENESETLLLTGETDSIIEYDIPEVEGFTAKPLETYKIAADGSTVVKVKYKRNLYKVTFYNDEEVYLSYEYKYGEKVSDISFRGNKQGYIFKEWDISLPFTVPAHDVDIHAVWNPSTTMKYTVRTYKQKVDGETFEVNETVKYDGTTDALTDVTANEIKGFYCDPINQVIIAADGSSIVEVYYYRETHKVTIKDFYGPGIDKVIEGLYEANIQIDEEPFYSGYYVYSYNLDSRKTVYNLKSVTIDSIDLEYTCNWRKLEFEVSVYIPSSSYISNYSIQKTNEEEYLIFETSGDIEGKCTWYLNKKKIELIDGKCKILIKDLRPGYYNLLLVVENGDEVKTGNVTFTINSGV